MTIDPPGLNIPPRRRGVPCCPVAALLDAATRANGKCLFTVRQAEALISAIAAHTPFGDDEAAAISQRLLDGVRANRATDSEPRNELGFTLRARLIGTHIPLGDDEAAAISQRLLDGVRANRAADSEPRNEFGFTLRAPLIGIDLSAAAVHARRTAARPDSTLSCVHAAQTEPLASPLLTASAQEAPGYSSPVFPAAQPTAAKPEQGLATAPQVAADEFPPDPSGDASCR